MAAVAALAEATEVAGELAQEQCLWLWQGWGGQQGSGSLATFLQAWGLCSREDTGKKNGQFGRSGHPHASHGSPAPTSTQGMSCGSSLLLLETQKNLTSASPNTIFLQPIPFQTGYGTCGHPRVCRDDFFRVLATSFWGLPAPSHHPRPGCQVPLAHSFCQHIQEGSSEGWAAHLVRAAPQNPSVLLKWRTFHGAQQSHSKGRTKQRWENGHQLEDLLILKAQPSPGETVSWEGKGFLAKKK